MGALLRTLGGLAVLFSVVGYLIIMFFIDSMNLVEMFWITNNMYISASATFLLDMLRVCFSLPTIILGAVLYKSVIWAGTGIFPGQSDGSVMLYRRLGSYAVVALTLVCIISYSYFFDKLQNSIFMEYYYVIFRKFAFVDSGDFNPNFRLIAAVGYFSIIVPFLFAIGVFVYKNISKKREIRRWALGALILAGTILMSVDYGKNVYDWQVSPIMRSEKSNYTWPADEKSWLLNHSLDKYIIVQKKISTITVPGNKKIPKSMAVKVVIVDAREAGQLEIHPWQGDYFKWLVNPFDERATIVYSEDKQKTIMELAK